MLMLLILTLTALTWAGMIRTLNREWYGYALARETVRVNDLAERILQAGQNLAFERGRTNVLLSANAPADAKNLAFIQERRKNVDENLRKSLFDPEMKNLPVAHGVQESLMTLQQMRLEVDRALQIPKDGRPTGLSERWFVSASSMIEDIGELVTQLSLRNDGYTASFRNFSRMKILAFNLRVQLGVEASRIAVLVSSGKAPTAGDLERLQELRGQEKALWDMLNREARVSRNPTVLRGIETIDREFYSTFRALQERALGDLRAGIRSSISPAELTAASVPALDSIAGLLTTLTAESDLGVRSYLAATRRSYAIAIVMSALALIAGLIAIYIAVFRFFLPLQKIGTILTAFARGDVSVELPDPGANSETNAVYRALGAVRDSLVERQTLERRLRSQSEIDGLTGLANRRRLDEALAAEWSRASRAGTPLAIAMFDVDFFKKYNDRYGHLAGDECLRKVAGVFGSTLRRPGDLAARYGGEEFVIVLPGLSVGQCGEWAESARKAIYGLALPHEDHPEGRLTVSAGAVSLVPTRDESILEIIRLADDCLYRAKAAGRNRVVLGE